MPLKSSELRQTLHLKKTDFKDDRRTAWEDLQLYRNAIAQVTQLEETTLKENDFNLTL